MTRVLLIGGGHAHMVALRRLASKQHDLELVLVSPNAAATYSGLVPGFIAGHWSRKAAEIDLASVASNAGAKLVVGAVERLDLDAQEATLESGEKLRFDIASLDIGSGVAMPAAFHGAEDVHPIKPLPTFMDGWDRFAARLDRGAKASGVAIIGSGAAGIEVALSVRHRLRNVSPETSVALIERSATILPQGALRLRQLLARELTRASIDVVCGANAQAYRDGTLVFDDGRTINANLVILTTGAKSQAWLQNTGLMLHDGYIQVDEALRSISHANVFAVGDTSQFTLAPLPKAGVFAVRQGPVLAENLCVLTSGLPLSAYAPQKDYLKLISLGDRRAAAEKWGVAICVPGLWSLKRWIDFGFTRAS